MNDAQRIAYEQGRAAAIADLRAFAEHWRRLEQGERGTGEAVTAEALADLLERGLKPPKYTSTKY